MKKYFFNSKSWCEEKKLADRKVLFLDTFAWSKIVRKDTRNILELRDLLLEKVKNKEIFVAINISLVSEVVDRDDTGQAKEIIKLFDDLSDGIFLKNRRTIFPKELKEKLIARIEKRDTNKLNPCDVFGPVWEILAEGQITQKNSSLPVDDKTASMIFEKMSGLKLSDFGEAWFHGKGIYREANLEYLKKRYENEIPKMSYQKILKEEQNDFGVGNVEVIRNVCLDILGKVGKEDKQAQDQFEMLMKPDMRDSVLSCPTANTYTTMMAMLRFNKDTSKSLTHNDFYDIFHLSNAIPYCDYILCDRAMADYIKTRLHFDQIYKTNIYVESEIPQLMKLINL